MSGSGPVELRGTLRAPAARFLDSVPGEPATDRRRGGDRWLVFDLPDVSLRVRCEASGGRSRVASWTATFRGDPPASLREAAEMVGMWPELAPDAGPGDGPMLRRRLETGADGRGHSATAAVRDGGIVQITAFDEPPDWTAG